MDEVRAPDKDKIKEDYLKGIKPKELSDKYDISINTLKSWIKRYGWSKEEKVKGAPNKKKGAPLNNMNAVGHGAPQQNKNAESHGFFSKYLPEETYSIIQEIQQKNPLDMLWENIQIAYAAIIRSQQIMYVRNKDDVTTTKIGEGFSDTGSSEKWEVQQAWDKQATFLKAQSRAQSELRSLIKQYDEMLHKNWELATEEQKLRMKALESKINSEHSSDSENKVADILRGLTDGINS